jgi:hypothetical protein
MSDRQTERNEKVKKSTVQIPRALRDRMLRYRNSLMPRPSMTDIATVGIGEYLDDHGSAQE